LGSGFIEGDLLLDGVVDQRRHEFALSQRFA